MRAEAGVEMPAGLQPPGWWRVREGGGCVLAAVGFGGQLVLEVSVDERGRVELVLRHADDTAMLRRFEHVAGSAEEAALLLEELERLAASGARLLRLLAGRGAASQQPQADAVR